jgi:hypothetical protein
MNITLCREARQTSMELHKHMYIPSMYILQHFLFLCTQNSKKVFVIVSNRSSEGDLFSRKAPINFINITFIYAKVPHKTFCHYCETLCQVSARVDFQNFPFFCERFLDKLLS